MNLGEAASEALVALLRTKSLTTVSKFYAEHNDPDQPDGNTSSVREVPCVACFFLGGDESPPGFGNFNGELHCRIELSADDNTQVQFDAIFSEVWQAIYSPTLLAELNAATNNFTAFGYTAGVSQGNLVVDGRLKYKDMIFPLNCTPFKVS